MYEKNKMREYIKNSELRIFNSEIKVRLSKELAIKYDNGSYKKFIYKDNIIYGLISQGDISYIGVLTQLIKNKVEIPDLKSRIFDVGYSDFFAMKENGEFEYSI